MRARTFAAVCFLSACVVAYGASARGDTSVERPIDVAKSKAQFAIQHVFVAHVVGTIPIESGSVTLPPDSPIPLGATAVLDASRVATGDGDRDAALRSPDYFDVKRFPTWTFTSTKIVPSGPAAFGMDGTLTIHGVSQPEHLDVTVRGDAQHPLYHATGKIDRHAFGMAVTRLDPAIGKTADVILDIALQ